MESKKEKSLVELSNEVAAAKGDRNKLTALQNYATALGVEKDNPERSESNRSSIERDLNEVNAKIESIEKKLVGTRPRASGSDPTPKPDSLVAKETERKVQTLPSSWKKRMNDITNKLKGSDSAEGKVQDVSKAVEQTLSQKGPVQPLEVADQKTNSPASKTPTFKMGGGRGGSR